MEKKVEEERKISPATIIVPVVGALGLAAVVGFVLTQAGPPEEEAPPTIYTCPYCGAEYSTKAELLAHIEAEHPGEPPVVYYTCAICGATFTTQEELDAHILAEHPEVPPEEIAAQILSIDWQLIDFPFVGYWPEETGPLHATFCKGTLQVESASEFVGSVQITCPNTIAPVPLLTAYGYQQLLAEIDELVATSTGAIKDLWQNRKAIALGFPTVDSFTIDYRWWADWDRYFRTWINASPVAVFNLDNVLIPEGTSTVEVGFFAKYGAAIGLFPAAVSLYSDETLLATIESDLVPPADVPQLLGVTIPTSVASGGDIVTTTVLRLPPRSHYSFSLSLDAIGYPDLGGSCELASVRYASTSIVNTLLARGCATTYLPLDAPDDIYTIQVVGTAEICHHRPPWAGGDYYTPLPPGVYVIKLSGESWNISVAPTGCGIQYWGLTPAAEYEFGVVGYIEVI